MPYSDTQPAWHKLTRYNHEGTRAVFGFVKRLEKLHADKGYDHRRCRRECRSRGIKPRIARRGVESSAHLGRHRWVVERSFAWLARFRRLSIRYECRPDLHLAITILACAIICMRQIRRFCS